ncbi:MAG: DegV family protein [Clostridia bacterium]|nr:DegV family protein [Clostridia bacterium]
MADFVIFADSSVDLPIEEINRYGLQIINLHLFVSGKEEDIDTLDSHAFYERLRAGEVASTSAPSPEEYAEKMIPVLESGKDILYLGFSEGLSCSYNNGKLAMEELAEKYPDRKLYHISTGCASTGHGLLTVLAARKQQAGATIEEVRDWVNENLLHLVHWFTVDDLMFLKRGGRISAVTAIAGTMLGIKPILHVDDEGHLINMSKARGRKASLQTMVDKVKEYAIEPATQTMAICHGDCLEEAEWIAEKLKNELKVPEVIISPTGTVIGAHSGPGTIAVFFLGTQR